MTPSLFTNSLTLKSRSIAFLLILFISPFILSGCAALFAAGAGTGAYSYIKGNLIKIYEADYDPAVNASANAIKQLKFKLHSKIGDALKTTIEGKRADDTPVTIEVERIGDKITRIGVRTGYVGIADMESSEQVHKRITKNLKRTVARSKKVKSSASAKNTSKPIRTSKKKKTAGASPSIAPQSLPKKNSLMYPRQSKGAETLSNKSLNGKLFYIFYQSNELDVPSRSLETLNSIADYLAYDSGSTIDVRSYTDSLGDTSANLNLSRKRAQAVKQYLLNKGIESSRISAEGHGATNFLESNRTEKLRAVNRRVELHIH